MNFPFKLICIVYSDVLLFFSSDFEPPVISQVPDITVNCGKSLLPSVIGNAVANDTIDRNPVLTYSDSDGSGCTVIRTWSAVDRAGNARSEKQQIKIVSLSPPQVNVYLEIKALRELNKKRQEM